MSDMKLELSVREEEIHLFKRSIRRLLSSTFVLREKNARLYAYLSREANRQVVSEYLRMMGFDLLVEERAGVCMLIPAEEDEETVGLRRENVVSFTDKQYHLLLILWKTYLENLGYQEGNFVKRGELIDRIAEYGLCVSKSELKGALRLFKKYSLIDYDKNEEELGENTKIRLYASLQFGWDLPQFRRVAGEYLKGEEEGAGKVETPQETPDETDEMDDAEEDETGDAYLEDEGEDA